MTVVNETTAKLLRNPRYFNPALEPKVPLKPEFKKPLEDIYDEVAYPKFTDIAKKPGPKTAEQPILIQHCAPSIPIATEEGIEEIPGKCVDIAVGFE